LKEEHAKKLAALKGKKIEIEPNLKQVRGCRLKIIIMQVLDYQSR